MTFAQLLEPEGIAAFAALVTGFVALLKYVFPPLDAKVSGALMAFVLTAIGYILCGASVGVATLDAGLLVFVAWVTCATASVGINSTVSHVQAVRSTGDDG